LKDFYNHIDLLKSRTDISDCPSLMCADCEVNFDKTTFRGATYRNIEEAFYWISVKAIENTVYFLYRCNYCTDKDSDVFHLCTNKELRELEAYI